MFVKDRLISRLVDRIDLAIDFATLGEYGLEPVEAPEAEEPHGEVIPLRPRPSAPAPSPVPVGLPPAAHGREARLRRPVRSATPRRPEPEKPIHACVD
jgi:hypothetical protein